MNEARLKLLLGNLRINKMTIDSVLSLAKEFRSCKEIAELHRKILESITFKPRKRKNGKPYNNRPNYKKRR